MPIHNDVCPDCGGYWDTCDCESPDPCWSCGKSMAFSEGRIVGEPITEYMILCENAKCKDKPRVVRPTRQEAIKEYNAFAAQHREALYAQQLDVCYICKHEPVMEQKGGYVTISCRNLHCSKAPGMTRRSTIVAIQEWNERYGASSTGNLTMHPYHCVKCGHQLYEKGLGVLGCAKCDEEYIPTSDPGYEKDFPGKQMMMVAWVESKSTSIECISQCHACHEDPVSYRTETHWGIKCANVKCSQSPCVEDTSIEKATVSWNDHMRFLSMANEAEGGIS